MFFSKYINFILNIIYPNVCGFCDEINKNSLCVECEKLITKEKLTRLDYINDKYFKQHGYLFKYDGIIRKKILDYKFNGQVYLYKTFSELIIRDSLMKRYINSFDVIIPVPIHKKRFYSRGYNQSELIAKEISKKFNIIYKNNIIKKVINNNAQSTLNKKERVYNVQNAYKIIKNSSIFDKKVLIVDDIFTTGNTVNECAKILKNNGAKYIGILTIARG